MALVPMTELLAKAEAGRYAVGAFNANNMEIVQAIAIAAERDQAPGIMQASQGAIKYAGLDYIIGMVNSCRKYAGSCCPAPTTEPV